MGCPKEIQTQGPTGAVESAAAASQLGVLLLLLLEAVPLPAQVIAGGKHKSNGSK